MSPDKYKEYKTWVSDEMWNHKRLFIVILYFCLTHVTDILKFLSEWPTCLPSRLHYVPKQLFVLHRYDYWNYLCMFIQSILSWLLLSDNSVVIWKQCSLMVIFHKIRTSIALLNVYYVSCQRSRWPSCVICCMMHAGPVVHVHT